MGLLHSRNLDANISALEFHVQHFWPRGVDRFDPRPPDRRRKQPDVKVRINHGRWLVDCPYCPGAQLADPQDHRFFCIDCLMVENQGRWVDVEWPDAITATTIEGVLDDRPAANRNWESWEAISFLLAENVMHGVGKPETQRLESQLDQHGGVSLEQRLADMIETARRATDG